MTASAAQAAFVAKIGPGAQQAQRDTGVPASLTIAQAILESGWGTTPLSVQASNYFGQKAHLGDSDPYQVGTISLPTWEDYGAGPVTVNATFYRYPDAAASIRSHARYLIGATGITAYQQRPLPVSPGDWASWIVTRPRCYATDPAYTSKLLKLMDQYGLRGYDITPDITPKEAPMTTEMPITIAATPGKVYSGTQTPTLIVIHDVECPCAVGKALDVAKYFATTDAGGVAHYTVDPATTTHSVPENRGAAHCGTYGNKNSVGIEMCGYVTDNWSDAAHVATWKRAANLAREIAARWGIPLTYLTAADLKAGKRAGWTYHMDITAGLGGTTHTDPGDRFPHADFRAYLERSDAITTPIVVADPVNIITKAPTWSTIRLGSTGEGVRAWTTWLHSMFSYAAKVAPGTYFGADTDAASREFQRRVGLKDDGVVGPLTAAAAHKLNFPA